MTSRSNKILANLDSSINPLTKRKFKSGVVGTALSSVREHLKQTPGPLGKNVWQNPKCPNGAFVDGKCFRSKKQVNTIVGVSKMMKDAGKLNANAKPVAKPVKPVAKPVKPIADIRQGQLRQLGKRYEALKIEKELINSQKRRAEVDAYLRKKNLNKALADKKKLENNHRRLQNEHKMALNQLASIA